MYLSFGEQRNLYLFDSLSLTTFYFNSSNNSQLNFCNKYLKSMSFHFKSLTNAARIEFVNCMQSIKIKFQLTIKEMYFSNPFRRTLIFRSNLPIFCIIK